MQSLSTLLKYVGSALLNGLAGIRSKRTFSTCQLPYVMCPWDNSVILGCQRVIKKNPCPRWVSHYPFHKSRCAKTLCKHAEKDKLNKNISLVIYIILLHLISNNKQNFSISSHSQIPQLILRQLNYIGMQWTRVDNPRSRKPIYEKAEFLCVDRGTSVVEIPKNSQLLITSFFDK